MALLDRLLTETERESVLGQLFNFTIEAVPDGELTTYIIYDEVGNEFNPVINDVNYHLETLESVIDYQSYRARLEGKTEAQLEIKSVLGITT